MEPKRVTIFCASSSAVSEVYSLAAIELGAYLATNKYHVVYGGGDKGLMGEMADAVIANEGKITGVIPHFMKELEWEHKGVTEMIYTETMAERKQLLVKQTDCVLVMPGSVGTLEEVFEVLSSKKLGLFFKPVIFYNVNNYFNDLLQHLDKMVEENFMKGVHGEMWQTASTINELNHLLLSPVNWPEDARKFAAS